MLNEIVIIAGIGIIQSILFSLLLLQKKSKQLSDWILLSWFLTFAIHLSLIILINNPTDQILIVLAKTITLLHGPFLLIYAKAVFNEKVSIKSLIHAFPFILLSVIAFFVSIKNVELWEIVLIITKTISLLFYPIYVGIWLNKKLKLIKTTSARNFIYDSYWIKITALIILFFAIFAGIHVLSDILLKINFSIILDLIFYVIMITIIGFYGLKFKVVYDSDIQLNSKPTRSLYKHSPLKMSEVQKLKSEIDSFFNTTEDYLNHNFSLGELSEKLNTPKHHLSEILNSEMGTTFYDIVNSKRIHYATNRLNEKSESNITLEALGYESGFNSKSSFFHHFKKYTGKTPRQYKLTIGSD